MQITSVEQAWLGACEDQTHAMNIGPPASSHYEIIRPRLDRLSLSHGVCCFLILTFLNKPLPCTGAWNGVLVCVCVFAGWARQPLANVV